MNKQQWMLAAILVLFASFARAQTVEYIHTDALGSPVAVTSASGAVIEVIERTVYEPYGAVINRPVTNGPGYTGHVMDAVTGLNYMQQRYYDPALGVFLSVDPVEAHAQVPAQFHRYRYANGNPYGHIDFDGRQAEKAPGQEDPPPPDIETVTVTGVYLGPGALFDTVAEAETQIDAQSSDRSHWHRFLYGDPYFWVVEVPGTDKFTYEEVQFVGGMAPLPGLSAGALKVLGNLKSLADKTVAAAIRSRGGGASQVQQVATHLRDAPVSQVANAAARKDPEAIKAIKMIKQAAKKAERY